jgi:5-methylcytosine-specific restriction endonuclease McrA
MLTKRDQAKKWAAEVRKRFPVCCICASPDDLAAHHVLPWEQWPELRGEISNGLTICRACHQLIHTPGGFYGKK